MTKSSDQVGAKAALMDAAVVEMAEKGWGGLRTRDVADRAGVNKGLVHYHFGSMDNLRVETVAMVMGGMVNEAASVVLEAPTVAEGIAMFGEHLDSFRPGDPQGVVLIEAMIHVPRERWLEEMMTRALDFYTQALIQRIEEDIEKGALQPRTDATGLATALTAFLDGLVLHAYMRPEVDFAPAAAAVTALLEGSAANPGEER